MDGAIAYRRANPSQSYAKIAALFNVSKSTLSDRVSGRHASHGKRVHRRLSEQQETLLIAQIEGYVSRGTLLTPAHITELVQAMCEERVGINWTSTFLRRHKDKLSSQFYSIQEAARLKADTPENRRVFYTLLKETLDTKLYALMNIYNMDECGFTLSSDRRTRRVSHANAPSKSQSALADDTHISVIAAISTYDAPVMPFVIYGGGHLIEEWLQVYDKTPALMATVTDSGYSNNYIAMQWLTRCFNPQTKDRAQGMRRLLILDGADSHIQVEFLEACWDSNIVCLILPAHLSGVFQPLDVNFFNPLKIAYHRQVDTYQLGSTATCAVKGMFYRWFQRSWQEVATSRQIRSAWRNAGIWPLSQEIMRARPATPEAPEQQIPVSSMPSTPYSTSLLQKMTRQVRRGSLSPSSAFWKASRALETTLAEKILMQKDLEKRQAAEALDQAARASKKRTRFPQGHLFDHSYREEHATELQERKATEQENAKKRKITAQRGKKLAQ